MRFKRIILAFIGATGLMSALAAQPGGPPSKEQRLAHLKEVLELTAEQTGKVSAILDTTQQQIDQFRASGSDDREKRREVMRKIMQDEDTRIEKVLTESQKKKYEQLKEERRKRYSGHGPGDPGPGGPGHGGTGPEGGGGRW